jgi:hypothetical protein
MAITAAALKEKLDKESGSVLLEDCQKIVETKQKIINIKNYIEKEEKEISGLLWCKNNHIVLTEADKRTLRYALERIKEAEKQLENPWQACHETKMYKEQSGKYCRAQEFI